MSGANAWRILDMAGPETPPIPERLLRDTRGRPPAGRPSAEAEVRLRPDLCPSVEEASAEAAGYLDWVCCRRGCGCGD
ncbi:hypothetical protein CNY89_15630 [Amaricoccus sp. HAR-UPW-R2A-40]|nr:hypothetical protein CNY89_15630 [Amaricoccus sp. HAR-UPW-R2A-40]